MNADIKLCKDCKHCNPEMKGFIFKKPDYESAKCTQDKRLNPVSGEFKTFEINCGLSREYQAPNTCGIDAQFFKEKQ